MKEVRSGRVTSNIQKSARLGIPFLGFHSSRNPSGKPILTRSNSFNTSSFSVHYVTGTVLDIGLIAVTKPFYGILSLFL